VTRRLVVPLCNEEPCQRTPHSLSHFAASEVSGDWRAFYAAASGGVGRAGRAKSDRCESRASCLPRRICLRQREADALIISDPRPMFVCWRPYWMQLISAIRIVVVRDAV
jgi:hypothetical protein